MYVLTSQGAVASKDAKKERKQHPQLKKITHVSIKAKDVSESGSRVIYTFLH